MESFPRQEDTSLCALNSIKEDSLDIGSLLIAGQSIENMAMRSKMWNEKNGVIVFSDETGRVFATPSTEAMRTKLKENAVERDENIGVPQLNNKENWNMNEQFSSFSKWKNLLERLGEKDS